MGSAVVNDEKGTIKISVRNLVEFILREGNLDNRTTRTTTAQAMLEGTRMHRKIQKRMGENYHAEVPLKLVLEERDYRIVIEGRADGIIIEREGEDQPTYADSFAQIALDTERVTIDEIKGIYQRLELLEAPVGVHRAQAMCYAYIYALQHGLKRIHLQMTYCNLDTEDIRYFREEFSFEALSLWFAELMEEYKKWADFQYAWRKLRQASIKKLVFPFAYRDGQRELAADVYRSIARKKMLFIEAPTGAGKTISTIFPAVKAVGEELSDKIFYLTAKTVTGTVAREAFALLRRQGYQAKTIQITAKEKMCPMEETECNPVYCPYAKGHFDRVNDAVFELLQREDLMDREVLMEQAMRHQVCPFEMCLDTASWADNIICDYNYVFDPNVYLKRFFAEGNKGDYLFLIDEAHNLVERSREMYSASLLKEDFLAVKKLLKPFPGKVVKGLERCNKILLDYKRECGNYVIYDELDSFMFVLQKLTADMDEFLQNHPEFPGRGDVLQFYFDLLNFRNIYELVDDRYVIYSQHVEAGGFLMKLYCVDPSRNLQERFDRGSAAVLFTATLLPIQYYKSLLSTRSDNYAVYAKTCFRPEQSLILVANDVSSKYTRRGVAEYEKIAAYIYEAAKAKTGNYMVFFPSYEMMRQVYELVDESYGDQIEVKKQQPGMREEAREEFLSFFSAEYSRERQKSFVAFCVLGGIFGEGIDLKEEQLIGVVIVGTGLPQIGNEREILKNYYESSTGMGFDYAYRYPGMNKVLQAGGRVIRTLQDVGVILLLDERFLQGSYRGLFPREWQQQTVCCVGNVGKYLQQFWQEQE